MKPQQKALMQQSQKLIINYLDKYMAEVEDVIVAIENEETGEYVDRVMEYIYDLEGMAYYLKKDTDRIIEGDEEE